MAISYTKRMFIERIVKHMNGDFPTNDFKITDNEIVLYIDAGIPAVLRQQLFQNATVTGVLDIPEAYLVTYQFAVVNKSSPTNEWYVTLPQPPLALPTGYDITNVYFGDGAMGRSQNVYPLTNKRAAYRNKMPKPTGVFYRMEGYNMYLQGTMGQQLLNLNLYVQIPISRTADLDAPMAIPDDAISPLFDYVVMKLKDRLGIPQDIVQDNLPQGNKTS